ncbi:MAG TPA: diaminopimelate epimerase [Candidatus Ornithomonoglobus merdipullorum]|uniref:Diaminopimelate epimerase n=1 Tax=Candidatus Ornithomonoglobus merdipullorum TaxID=2840895 RepID=A0A9D1MBB4_9FIRM|nr:diaminopimelate epimerase [Candidatus Ornithomonoglobus merdipullorum]
MQFTKMQGAGNDYVYVNCLDGMIDNVNEAARIISDRHFGVGSDGLVLICPSDKADFRMDMYNSDGSQAEMCGNASRCVGKYVHDKGLTDKTVITLETLAGIKTLELTLDDKGETTAVRVNMGAPELDPAKIPIADESKDFIDREIEVDGKKWRVTGVSMGNPHAVTFIDDVDGLDIEKIGPRFENDPLFPRRVNTEFACVRGDKTIRMRVWERGAGETLACGTGACATLVAAALCGLVENEADLELTGGTLHIEWDRESNNVYMTGPAEFVFEGEITV